MTTTTAQLETFRQQLQAVNAEHYAELNAKIPGYFGPNGITFTVGKKNACFMIESGGQKSYLLFVELETGNILKSAGKVPAKGARGNIHTSKVHAGSGWLYR